MTDQKKRGTFIHGIAASQALDSSGERIDISGIDISSLTVDGILNWEHSSKEASSIIGKIFEAKKILKRSDCENDNHRFFWDKIKIPYLYVAAELFDSVGHKEAMEVAAMVRYDQQDPINKDARKLINFSIEGSRIEKQGSTITKCIARKISCTILPCNKTCIAEELKINPKEEKHSDSGDFKFIQDIMSKADEPSCQIMKGENPFLYKVDLDLKPKSPEIAPTAPKTPKVPKKPVTNIARPDVGHGAIHDKTKPPKPGYGKVITKGKKTPVKMTAKEAVDEHEKLVNVLESPSHKDDKIEAKKQRKELKEYKKKLNKDEKKINHKDPVLGKKPVVKPASKEYEEKSKEYLKQKLNIKKTEEVRSLKPCPSCKTPLTTANTRYEGVQETVNPDYDLSLHTCHKCKSTAAVKIPKQKKKNIGKSEKIDLMKPYVSDAQRRWAHTPKGKEALGGAKAVAHWDRETKGKKLPERKKKLSKYDSNVRKALTASCGVGSAPSSRVDGEVLQGEKIVKSELGHTSSGKSIHTKFISPLFHDWTHQDHMDAHKKLHEHGHKVYTEALNNDDTVGMNHGMHLKGLATKHKEAAQKKISKSEVRRILSLLGTQALERLEKKEELIEFLSIKLPKFTQKQILAFAKAVAYLREKRKEVILKSLVKDEDE